MEKQIGDGVLRCAEFVQVIRLNKEAYPNGVETYKVKMEELEEEKELTTKD